MKAPTVLLAAGLVAVLAAAAASQRAPPKNGLDPAKLQEINRRLDAVVKGGATEAPPLTAPDRLNP